jgi:CheY-like chemotaxis protein
VNDHDVLAERVHDLKTPLAVVMGYAELLAGADDELRTLAADQILMAARQLETALDSLLGVAPRDAEPEVQPAMSKPARRKGRFARILLVDDDIFIRRLLRITLPVDEFEIAEASDGDIALELIEAQRPELVLLDWQMPVAPGATVLARLQERHPNLPVIVLTADATQRDRAMELGAVAFLTKPFSPLGLLRAIEALLADGATKQVA